MQITYQYDSLYIDHNEANLNVNKKKDSFPQLFYVVLPMHSRLNPYIAKADPQPQNVDGILKIFRFFSEYILALVLISYLLRILVPPFYRAIALAKAETLRDGGSCFS